MKQLLAFLDLIKFEHTVFALPFAYLGMVLAAHGLPTLSQFFWITVAMASARTLGMGFNRLADRHIDARNPRTASRPIQTGKISLRTVVIGVVISLLILALAAWQLNPLTLALLPGAIVFLLGYAYAKRFTWLSHFILGFTDGLAPIGAWAAIKGSVFTPQDLPAWLLLFAVTFWIGGFDLIYACQDTEFDRVERLHSIPARWGNAVALGLAKISHVITVGMLLGIGIVMGLGLIYWLGILAVVALLVYEHSLVKPDDLTKLNVAFFNINGYISMTIFVATFLAVVVH
ncbi:MAG: putative 4-hydroxybenzoate polyprenyltransferase [Chloroflexi bacterium]|nr:putative 4-hydroxybenzoate polyprenyltransferase [Chloroflexota bacterium]MCL5273570.1 putative 4-hydroxybenzoate polyprenyltransferase [Chloroflexota bacterium]